MKLVEILAAEMEEWPEGVTHLTQSEVDREIYNALDGKKESSAESLNPRFDTRKTHTEDAYPIVTRAQWQAERDRQKGGEWKRHRGNSQPVDEGTWVEVKLRCGDIQQGLANAFLWRHADCDHAANIMQYKVISQPQAEEVDRISEAVHKPIIEALNSMAAEWHEDQIDGPIKWRDQIVELEAHAEDIQREIASLFAKLNSEGFQLIRQYPSVSSEVPAVDMSDWRNWKAGDVVECTYSDCESIYTVGNRYDVDHVTSDCARVSDDLGKSSFCKICDADSVNVRFKLVQ